MTRELSKRKAMSTDHSPGKAKTIDKYFKSKNAKNGSNKTKQPADTEQSHGKPKLWVEWQDIGETWVGHYGTPAPAVKFAAFDLDHTLVTVKGKWRFPKGPDDWQFVHPSVPKVLHSLHDQGYKILIISNQNGFKRSKKTPGVMPKNAKDFRIKISDIANVLGIPFTILVATAKDYMRKPSPGMWHIAELLNSGAVVDKAASFYVGDAAGRPAGFKQGAPADFSDSDAGFALNVGVPFYTPEEMFHGKNGIFEDSVFVLPPASAWRIGRFMPKELVSSSSDYLTLLDSIKEEVQQAQSAGKGLLLVLVGPPACGKSTFTQSYLEPLGFERINMDTLKTRKKCEYAVREALKAGECVVVDNTNPDAEARGSFIDLAQTHGARSVAVVFKHSSKDLTMHNNCFRASIEQARHFHTAREQDCDHQSILDSIPVGADRVPTVAYNGYYKRFVLPAKSEGFSRVLHHVFIPDFASPEEKKIWYQYY
ncbi:hypothetical protein IW140_005901 [Coemansia sp. RSA 1813]|nr:hypothetical protein EV178_005890 [Coemansia sp. RSA 1646]KAJ1767647.1 hypothetical protein LPJ74_005256 [Coemansia sp. RSA 1843]KAJ2086255.1 hypothetical protein IW138_005812 [Coemansia sp. RSA 986]KAJ2210926.1 hypothetical protein EV179_005884 [Coemansia sp. RSA 487]KAJ2564017.1 hypothetical protein IW140_005901 [Coemansia sp. RSA 1813]